MNLCKPAINYMQLIFKKQKIYTNGYKIVWYIIDQKQLNRLELYRIDIPYICEHKGH